MAQNVTRVPRLLGHTQFVYPKSRATSVGPTVEAMLDNVLTRFPVERLVVVADGASGSSDEAKTRQKQLDFKHSCLTDEDDYTGQPYRVQSKSDIVTSTLIKLTPEQSRKCSPCSMPGASSSAAKPAAGPEPASHCRHCPVAWRHRGWTSS